MGSIDILSPKASNETIKRSPYTKMEVTKLYQHQLNEKGHERRWSIDLTSSEKVSKLKIEKDYAKWEYYLTINTWGDLRPRT